MDTKPTPPDIRRQRRQALFKSLVIPVLLLLFFAVAPAWLNHQLHHATAISIENNAGLAEEDKIARMERLDQLDFAEICLHCPPGGEKMYASLKQTGIVANFERLRWALWLSLLLVAGLGTAVWIIFTLNQRAAESQAALVRSYRLGWKVAMAAALAKVFLLVPLLAYAAFELPVLLTDHYLPKLLFVIILGGIVALWKSGGVLLKQVPLEFNENLAREVTPAEAPELWEAVRYAAIRLQTTPPDRILMGMQFNFYVTELAVKYQGGQTQGKTLFLSLPMLKQLSEPEVAAIIGHELGHFIGEDTRLTREFYPLRLKVRGTMIAMATSAWVGWPSFQFLNFFALCFGETERATSRRRELLADQTAATLTDAQTTARALVRLHVAAEAFQRNLKSAVKNPLDVPMQTVIQEKLAGETAFWTQLFEKKLAHPLDTHPPLHVRLEALGQRIGEAEAQAIALEKPATAYEQWFGMHGDLFTSLNQQAEQAVVKIQTHSELTGADYQTESGREFLDRHFPEKKWRVRPASYWVVIALFGLLALLCVTVAIVGRDPSPAPRIIFSLIALCLAGLSVMIFRRHYQAELTLNAEGLRYSSWSRPLLFKDVQKLSAQRVNANIILIFQFKAKQPPLWKFGLLRFPISRTGLSLSNLEGKPAANAEIIFKYFTRQAAR